MSKNSDLVAFFMGETFRTHKGDLNQYVSSNFVFKSSRYGELDFENYVSYAAQYYREEKVVIEWINSSDDQHFGVAYTAHNELGQKVFGVLAVTLIDSLIVIVAE
ncbi:MAG: hypothetical protein OCD03_03195 [Hyphomicrobiales bacterium]